MIETVVPHDDPTNTRHFAAGRFPALGMVQSLFESSDDCMKIINADGVLEMMNCNGRAAMEIDNIAAVEGQEWATLWPPETQDTVRRALAEALAGKVARFEAFCPTAKGTPKWWDVTVAPIAADSGAVEWVLSASRDITERVVRGEQLDTMAQELRHRLRNAYAVSAGLIKVMARERPEHAGFAGDAAQHLHHLAGIQSSLLDFGGQIALTELVGRLREGTVLGSAVTLDIPPALMLAEAEAKALAMVIGELLTNSSKYGALATGGTIRLSGSAADGAVTLDWAERNGTAAAEHAPVSSGQGSLLKQRMMASIGGTIERQKTDDGFFARLTFPLSGAVGQA